MKGGQLIRILITPFALIGLIIGEAVIAAKIFEKHSPAQTISFLDLDISFWSVTHIPLFVILIAVIVAKKPAIIEIYAWLCILAGFFMQHEFHASHDPSKVLILLISIFVYWVGGLIALISICSTALTHLLNRGALDRKGLHQPTKPLEQQVGCEKRALELKR